MSNELKLVEYDALTGIETVREYSEEELLDHKEVVKRNTELLKAEKAKEEAKKSALAKLAELGLTEEEIASL
jgi:hypothetical protein